MEPSVMSLAVMVREPALLKVTLRVRDERDAKDAGDGSIALVSEEVSETVSLVVTRFQLTSTALTVTENGTAAVWAMGVPTLPSTLPGAAVSPGARS